MSYTCVMGKAFGTAANVFNMKKTKKKNYKKAFDKKFEYSFNDFKTLAATEELTKYKSPRNKVKQYLKEAQTIMNDLMMQITCHSEIIEIAKMLQNEENYG